MEAKIPSAEEDLSQGVEPTESSIEGIVQDSLPRPHQELGYREKEPGMTHCVTGIWSGCSFLILFSQALWPESNKELRNVPLI